MGIGTTVLNLVEFSIDYSKSPETNMFWFRDTANSTDTNRFIFDYPNRLSKLKESESKLEDLVKIRL